ncbi:hypothetical protein I7I48_01067 [Histoplasma ohiense]|nr:hypothetical protein I7I48_01067 [Histoplasma ohiense (nom. inval.)]
MRMICGSGDRGWGLSILRGARHLYAQIPHQAYCGSVIYGQIRVFEGKCEMCGRARETDK